MNGSSLQYLVAYHLEHLELLNLAPPRILSRERMSYTTEVCLAAPYPSQVVSGTLEYTDSYGEVRDSESEDNAECERGTSAMGV